MKFLSHTYQKSYDRLDLRNFFPASFNLQMAVGHIAFDTWPVKKQKGLRLWFMDSVFTDLRYQIVMISDADFTSIAESKDVTLSEASKETLRKFTELLEVSMFGTPAAPRPFTLLYAIVNRDREICWSSIVDIVNPSCHRTLKPRELPKTPFIVTHTISGKAYLINCVTEESAATFIIPVNQFGSTKQDQGQMLMTDFYKEKYGLRLSPNQPVLIGSIGTPIRPDAPADIPSLSVPKAKKPNVRSQVYLAPEVAKLHPITEFIDCINRIPRLLFQLESGAIAADVQMDLFMHEKNDFWEYIEFFKPSRPSYFFKSNLLSLTAAALTRPSANLTVDYEYLEWLGDAVFRFVLAVLGLRDVGIRSRYFHLMSNNNIGKMAQKSYPELCNSYILSLPPSLKTPELCRERLQNLNILADVAEALVTVSLFSGGIRSVARTIQKLGLDQIDESSIGLVPPAPNDVGSFIKSAVRPSVIRLEASFQLIKNGDPHSLDVGQLDEARKLLIASLSKKDLSSFDLYNKYCCFTD